MARRKGVFRAERGAEGVNIAERKRKGLAVKLAADGEVCRGAEEILREIHRAVLRARRVGRVKCRDAEHLARTLTVARRDQRGMHIKEAALIKEAVDRLRHHGAHAERGLEGVRARAQMLDGAQIFQRMALLLQRIIARAFPFDGDGLGADLKGLRRIRRKHEFALDGDRAAGIERALDLIIHPILLINDLHGLEAGAVRQFNKADGLARARGLDPAGNRNGARMLFRAANQFAKPNHITLQKTVS